MSRLLIEGAKKLSGEVEVQGAKNSALPILAATILCRGENILHNCSNLSDVDAAVKILRYLGGKVSRHDKTMLVNTDDIRRFDIPHGLMREMRSSIVFLGAVLSRNKRAKLSFPGGCELGPRPIDLHLKALRQMGAIIKEYHGILDCSAPKGLKGTKIALSFPSVGATENIMLAAVNASGTTTITNAAREPEICDLADFLNKCGAKIYGAGEGTIVIDGVDKLDSAQHTIISDRIVTSTLMSCAAITGSEIIIRGIVAEHLNSIISTFEEAGCKILCSKGSMYFQAPEKLRAVKSIRTMPYPGFPTDAQAPVMSALTVADGTTCFVENIFESRYKHVGELARLGANIKVEGKVAIVEGVDTLSGAFVEAQDLRGAAALVTAGLAAEGTTEVAGIKYLERGYENFEVVLSGLGATVKKI
ncbi:MAG: UDP-N-acetylglucosamine 1-carboxyvinyltransferase [Ruminococcus sp.]|nr:UDP-N-acetylglucosamine 1-carboxyvinyltransferase [Ruminococcus sp.]